MDHITKLFTFKTFRLMILKLGMGYRGFKVYNVCIHHDPWHAIPNVAKCVVVGVAIHFETSLSKEKMRNHNCFNLYSIKVIMCTFVHLFMNRRTFDI